MTVLVTVKKALQDAIEWQASLLDASTYACAKNPRLAKLRIEKDIKEFESLLNVLGHVTREKAFARWLDKDAEDLTLIEIKERFCTK